MNTPSSLAAPLKWHGGKHYLAGRIVELMPPHVHYVEPFAGGLAALLARSPEGLWEAVCDKSRELTTFWRVLQGEDTFRRFVRFVESVPFSQIEWQDAPERLAEGDPVARAAAFFVRCRQSLAGRLDTFAPLSRNRTRRGMNERASAWLSAVEGLPAVHARLIRVAILDGDALDVIRTQDGPDTLFYCDPPYLHQTRTAKQTYAHEMSEEDHAALLAALRRVKGKVMLSGYESEPYERELAGWTRHAFDVPNHAAGGRAKRRMKEVLWCNW